MSTRWNKPGGGRLSRKVVTRWAISIPILVPPSATPATAMRITATVHSSTAPPCWANAPIGNYQYSNWKRADLYCFRPALAKLLSDLRQRHPNVDIYFILNSELKDEINESVKKICKTYQVPVIALHDIDKKNGHPTIKGMRSLADQVLKVIKK